MDVHIVHSAYHDTEQHRVSKYTFLHINRKSNSTYLFTFLFRFISFWFIVFSPEFMCLTVGSTGDTFGGKTKFW